MLVIGLTGGIGSGKSTVANLFAEYQVPIIDADIIAREMTLPGHPGYEPVIAHFGSAILQPDGQIDRKKLRQIIFSQPEEKQFLENLLHPLIRQEIERQINTQSAPYVIVVIPLLLESPYPYHFIQRILVVDAPIELQIERGRQRDQTQAIDIEAIINSQISREQRLALADEIIENAGKVADLIPQVRQLHEKYLIMSQTQL